MVGVEAVDPHELPKEINTKIDRQIKDRAEETEGAGRNDVYMLTSFGIRVSGKKQPGIGALVSVVFPSATDGMDIGYFAMACSTSDITKLQQIQLIDQNRFTSEV